MKAYLFIIVSAVCIAQSVKPDLEATAMRAVAAELKRESPRSTLPSERAVLATSSLQTKVEEALAAASNGELPPAAQHALTVNEPWKEDRQTPAAGKDGRVVYTFGAGLATVVCAPLRVCVVELEPGEKVVGEPHIGDAMRWAVSPALSGAGPSQTVLVIIKPKETGLDTNLVVPTNRRTYYLRLLSKHAEYLPLVAFDYPPDPALQWREVAASPVEERIKEEAADLTPVENLESLNFDYTITGGTEFLRPIRVMDDGKKTFIQMPSGATVRELPMIVVAGLDSPAEMVNYRVKGSLYIVDRLFERGALLLGGGKKRERVDIVRSHLSSKKKSDSIGAFLSSVKSDDKE
jgi:type IV secretion system protein TrbG